MPSYENDVHANFCPITQALPYYIYKAFPDIEKKKWLPLVVSFKFGEAKALELFCEMTKLLGIDETETKTAFYKAWTKQKEYFEAVEKMGLQALQDC